MNTFDQLLELVQTGIKGMDLPPEPALLYEPIRYSLEEGGKRIRPVALLAGCEMFGGDPCEALSAALAVEVFHNFTLLHDDIMDNAPTRRGKPAVHKRWDSNVAILSGDVMMIGAYRLLAKLSGEKLTAVLGIFNEVAVGVCEGQSLDMQYESHSEISVAEYLEMIRLKTAVLLAGAFKIGARLAGTDVHRADIMYSFGLNVGMAFQIQDDLLDTYSDEATLGKNIGVDILAGKKTFLLTNALALADPATKMRLQNLTADQFLPAAEKIACVKTIYDSLAVKTLAEKTIEQYFDTALSLLETLDTPHEKLITTRELADIILNRKK